jgi:hypothetical protein
MPIVVSELAGFIGPGLYKRERPKLYSIEVKKQLNELKDEIQYAKNAIYSC